MLYRANGGQSSFGQKTYKLLGSGMPGLSQVRRTIGDPVETGRFIAARHPAGSVEQPGSIAPRDSCVRFELEVQSVDGTDATCRTTPAVRELWGGNEECGGTCCSEWLNFQTS
ncbi:MAG TPA: hypothetical protein VMP01_22930 [Pirellulaceae bacterium]|nr:hypothetical protein [Pirellulaceae bacterium]